LYITVVHTEYLLCTHVNTLYSIATPLSMDEFAWTKKQAVLYNDIFFVGLAVIAILTFLTVKFITKL